MSVHYRSTEPGWPHHRREMHPTHWLISAQVGNTVKRVVIIAAAMVVLGEAMEPVAMVGTTVAIAGVLLYSILKQRLA